jgi:hypothetical protein
VNIIKLYTPNNIKIKKNGTNMGISSKISFTGEKKNITVLQISGYNKIRVDHHNLKVT